MCYSFSFDHQVLIKFLLVVQKHKSLFFNYNFRSLLRIVYNTNPILILTQITIALPPCIIQTQKIISIILREITQFTFQLMHFMYFTIKLGPRVQVFRMYLGLGEKKLKKKDSKMHSIPCFNFPFNTYSAIGQLFRKCG